MNQTCRINLQNYLKQKYKEFVRCFNNITLEYSYGPFSGYNRIWTIDHNALRLVQHNWNQNLSRLACPRVRYLALGSTACMQNQSGIFVTETTWTIIAMQTTHTSTSWLSPGIIRIIFPSHPSNCLPQWHTKLDESKLASTKPGKTGLRDIRV